MKKPIATAVLLTLGLAASAALAQGDKEAAAVTSALANYAAAIQNKDLGAVEKYVVAGDDFSMFEGGHINWGWADYRDHHLGPELKQFLQITYSFAEIKPHVYGQMAYATLKSSIVVKMEGREFEGESLATVVLRKTDDGWKIQHMHTSRIPRRNANQ